MFKRLKTSVSILILNNIILKDYKWLKIDILTGKITLNSIKDDQMTL